MASKNSPGINKVNQINEVANKMIEALYLKGESSSIDPRDIIVCIDEARDDEILSLLMNLISDNNSKISDLDEVARNWSFIDLPMYEGLYGRNLTDQNRAMIRKNLVSDNASYFDRLKKMNIEYGEVKDEKDYLNIQSEIEGKGKNGEKTYYLDSVYGDLRRYTERQIESDINARTIYHMAYECPDELEVLMQDKVIKDAVIEVLRALSIDDLKNIIEDRENGNLVEAALDAGAMNEDNEFLIGKLNPRFSEKVSKVIDDECALDAEIISNSYESKLNSYNDELYDDGFSNDEDDLGDSDDVLD